MARGLAAKERKSAKKRPKSEVQAPAASVAAVPSKRLIVLLCLALAVATAAVYAQAAGHGFIAYDDDQYVYQNPQVKAGLTGSGVAWAFTTFFYANWHPLTWLSLMLDAQIFGQNAGAYHMVNLALHLAGTLLLFVALARMTRQPWRCAMVAGIFALHPLHVESVAWISERKDVLSTALAMLALLLYVRYVESRTKRRFAYVALGFALSLLAKPMLVTFPFVLLLLDFWPLQRMRWPPSWQTLKPLLVEKTPLFAMVVVSSVLTFLAQRNFGAVETLTNLPLTTRLANAATAYVAYLAKAFVPTGLGVLYPVRAPDPAVALASFVALAAITYGALRQARRRPYLLVGWLWYLGTLVPVIGLVQAGAQSMADRYTYLPLIGISLALVWWAADAAAKQPMLRVSAGPTGVVVLLLLAIAAYGQTGYWKNSRTLFEHTVSVTQGNYIILNNLGVTLAEDGEHARAMDRYREAIAIRPDYAEATGNLGHELIKAGHLDEAYPYLVKALQLKPGLAIAQTDLGVLLAARGDFQAASQHLQESLRVAPENAEAQSDLCFVLQRLGDFDGAMARCQEALRLKPDFSGARYNLATALAASGKKAAAIAELSKELAADPGNSDARAVLEKLQAER